MATIRLGHDALTVAVTRSLVATAGQAGPRLGRRLREWLLYRRSLAELAAAEPRMRRDIGLPPDPRDALIRTFGLDTRPLREIGQVPQPVPQARPPRR